VEEEGEDRAGSSVPTKACYEIVSIVDLFEMVKRLRVWKEGERTHSKGSIHKL